MRNWALKLYFKAIIFSHLQTQPWNFSKVKQSFEIDFFDRFFGSDLTFCSMIYWGPRSVFLKLLRSSSHSLNFWRISVIHKLLISNAHKLKRHSLFACLNIFMRYHPSRIRTRKVWYPIYEFFSNKLCFQSNKLNVACLNHLIICKRTKK